MNEPEYFFEMEKKSKKFVVKENDENDYHLCYGDKILLKCNKEDLESVNKFVDSLNLVLMEKDYEIESYCMMMEFYQKLVADTLSDKLADIDNMYAMKKLLTEICDCMENMGKRIIDAEKSGLLSKNVEKNGK